MSRRAHLCKGTYLCSCVPAGRAQSCARKGLWVVAIFHWSLQTITRADGRSSVACAAYRAGACLRDDRTGIWTDYSYRRGIRYEVILPDGVTAPSSVRPNRPHDLRSVLWNRAEEAENRGNSVTAREFNMALPRELSDEANWSLAKQFSAWVVARYGVAADVALHLPDGDGDQRNLHSHVLFTTRRVGPGLVFGEKTRVLDYIPTGRKEIVEMRTEWARVVNHALEAAGRPERIDHRSLVNQGIDREPTRHLGPITTNRIRAAEKELAAAQAVFDDLLAAEWRREVIDLIAVEPVAYAKAWNAQSVRQRPRAKRKPIPTVVIINEQELGPLGPYMTQAVSPAGQRPAPPAPEPEAVPAVTAPARRKRASRATAAELEVAVGEATMAEVEQQNRRHAVAEADKKRKAEEAEVEKRKLARRPKPLAPPQAAKVPLDDTRTRSKAKKPSRYEDQTLNRLVVSGDVMKDRDEEERAKPPKKLLKAPAGISKSTKLALGMSRGGRGGKGRGGKGGRGR